jgi:preprotein translocase subunit SecF
MQFFNKETRIDFMSKRKIALVVSAIVLLVSVGSLATRGLNFGIDFTGGTLVEVGYDSAVELNPVRGHLAEVGFDDAIVQHFGTAKDVLVRLPPREGESTAEISTRALSALDQVAEGMTMRRVEFVGPQVGEELTEQGGLAVLFALGAILIYVALRFEWRFAMGSVAALAHDVMITLGVFSLLQVEFDLSVLAAVLAVIGYSLNDTIVVFDRIRERFREMLKSKTIDVMNLSINQTLGRTIMTSLTTLLVLLALFFLGGEVIHGFSVALLVGVVVGTYSSIFVASTTALALGVTQENLMPVEVEGREFDLDQMP